MGKQHTLQFSLTDLYQVPWQLQTKVQSLGLGRKLYQLQIAGQGYWLKTQVQKQHAIAEKNYLNELHFYQQMQSQLNCLLSVQYFDLFEQDARQSYTSLLLPHASPWLTSPSELSLLEIQAKIMAMLDCIAELAQYNLIHADLKQEHFVCWQGQAKLLDFEQVQPNGHLQSHLSATPRYMAPELFHHKAKTVRSELYALGIILYEWLKGERLMAKSYLDWAYLHCQHLKIELPERYQSFSALICALTTKQVSNRCDDILRIKQQFLQLKH